MYEVKSDLDRNRIYITLGRIEKEDVKQIIEAIRGELVKLEIGFACITDIREFDPKTEDETQKVIEIQKTMVELGMEKVIRVVGASQLPHIMMDHLSKEGAGYSAGVATSVDEAEKLLDEMIQ